MKTATVTVSSGGISSDPTDCTAGVTVASGVLDQIPPVITAFTVPSTSTSLTTNISTFTATDNLNAVAGYLVTESAIPPSVGNPGWSATPQTSYTFSTEGNKTLYAWVKDADWNISSSASQTVIVDTTAPSISAFLVPAISTSRTIPITTFTASDTIGVTGYFINEEFLAPNVADTGWSVTPQTSYTVSTDGYKVLISWAKDALGHVSGPIDRTVLVDTIPPTVTAFSVPATSSSLTVDVTSFTATDNIPADHGNTPISGYLITESATPPIAGNPGWSAIPQTSYTFSTEGNKTLYAWAKDSVGHISTSSIQEITVDTSWVRVNYDHSEFCNTINGLATECEALMNIFDNNGGSNWTHKIGWGISTNMCSWEGVGCTGLRVVTLDLSNNHLIHPFAITQGSLDNLQHLNLQNNHIVSFDGMGLGSLLNLDVSNNNITTFSGISLASLTDLNLSFNLLTSFDKTGLSALERLYLSENLISSFNTAGMSTIRELDLSYNILTSFDGGGLISLTNIWLGYNHINSLQNIPNIPAVDPNLYNNCLSRSTLDPALASWLDGWGADFETRSDFCPPTFCDTVDIPAAECEALLNIYDNSGGDNWTDKTGWGTLTTVCDHGFYTGHSWYGVRCGDVFNAQGLHHVEGLDLSHNGLTGSFTFSQGNLNSLTSLDLSNNQLTSFENVGTSSLTHLILNGNQLTSFNASGLNSLTTLYINNNHITTLENNNTLTNLMSMYATDNCLIRSSLGTPMSTWLDSHADENWERRNAFCSAPPVTVTCTPSKLSAFTGETIVWNAIASGGSGGDYTYEWIGDGTLTGTGNNLPKTYVTPGSKTARVIARSGNISSASTDCTSAVNIVSPGGGSSISLYGCGDPKALNYKKNIINNSKLCQYPPGIKPAVIPGEDPKIIVSHTPSLPPSVPPTTIPKLNSAGMPPTTSTASCDARLYPTKYIRLGQQNDPEQVKLLEQYLTIFEGEYLPIDGIYSQEDANAVIRWQEKYASEILVPWGETHGTGYVFITSLRKFKMLFESQCQKNTTEKPDPSVLFPRDLRLEMEGDDVRRLQEILIKKATGPAAQELAKTGITGHFGPLTKAALIEFQKSRLLNPANGEMGIITVYLLTE